MYFVTANFYSTKVTDNKGDMKLIWKIIHVSCIKGTCYPHDVFKTACGQEINDTHKSANDFNSFVFFNLGPSLSSFIY